MKKFVKANDVEADDDITMEELEEQLSDELDLDDVDDVEAEDTEDEMPIEQVDDEVMKEAEKLLNALDEKENKDVEAEDQEEVKAITKEADELLKACEADAELPDNKEIVSEEQEVLDACDELEKKIESCEADDETECKDCEKTASEEKPGIEDEIGDEANGGDPSVSEITKSKVDCDTDKEVFPTNSEYVARITRRLDRVANVLEKRGMKRMAFRIDQLSDKIEASIRK